MKLIGVDTGGTFTDFIYDDGKDLITYKILSTPQDPADAVLKGLNEFLQSQNYKVIHGSTVAINAILERKGQKVAFITNRGFKDIIEIGRQNRKELYNMNYQKAPLLIPRDYRFEISGRLNHRGEEIMPLDTDEINALAQKIKAKKIKAVAIMLLHSYLNPSHELKVAKILRAANLEVSVSHQIICEFREYERAFTTCLNAYISPTMSQYIDKLAHQLGNQNFAIMQSNGGRIACETAREKSIETILSGPAAGVVGAYALANNINISKLMTFDMGGTSTDVALIDGKLPLTYDYQLLGEPLKVPTMDIHTVGAGGGSLVDLDAGQALKVGPESAAADPGPICYGKGEIITVTDANLYLNRLIPQHFLGGKMKLYPQRIKQYMTSLARKAALEPHILAQGVLDVANANMERALRVISVERGKDPAEYSLFSFGGAGGLHAVFLAQLLKMPQVIVPPNPGTLSALGMIVSDVIKDISQTVFLSDATSAEELANLFKPLEAKLLTMMAAEGFKCDQIIMEKSLDMRYQGQSFEITIPYSKDYLATFHSFHQQQYGYSHRETTTEIVNIKLKGQAIPPKIHFQNRKLSSKKIDPAAELFSTETFFANQPHQTKVFARSKLDYGMEIAGPAIVVEYSSTLVLPPNCILKVDNYLNLVIEVSL